ncbi:hypothetical protein [Streptomyces sp. NPDC050416]
MSHSDTPVVREFAVADRDAGPYGITTTPDGTVWAALETGAVARVTP